MERKRVLHVRYVHMVALLLVGLWSCDATTRSVRELQVIPPVPPTTPNNGLVIPGPGVPTPSPTTKKPVNRPWISNSGNTKNTTSNTTPSGATVIGNTDDSTRPGYSMDTGVSTFLGLFNTEKIYVMSSIIIPAFFLCYKFGLWMFYFHFGMDHHGEKEENEEEEEEKETVQSNRTVSKPLDGRVGNDFIAHVSPHKQRRTDQISR